MSAKKKLEVEITDGEADESAAESTDETAESDSQEEAQEGAEVASEAPELTEEEDLQRKLHESEDRLLRLAADFENYKKRTARQYDDMMRSANERLLSQLLDVMDSFDRAIEQVDESNSADKVLEGMKLIHGQLGDLLGKHNVKAMASVGEAFDPSRHEALMQVDSDDVPEGSVAMEMARGYTIGDRVLRFAKVGVSSGPAANENENK